MKKFIKHFLLFVAPIVILAYFVDVFISNNLKKCNGVAIGEFSTWNDLNEGMINSDIVIYGSSRAWKHLSPKIITQKTNISAYNLGIEGHNFWLQNLRHKILFKKNKKPKLIIFSVDIFTLQKNKDLYNSEQFLPYMLWNNQIEETTISYNGFNRFDYNMPLIRYYGKYKEVVKAVSVFLKPTNNKIKRVNGYQGQNKKWSDDFSKAKLKMKKYKISLDEKTVVLFEKFLKDMNEEGVKVVFVYSPEYIEGQKFIEGRKELISLYTKYSEQYHVPFYDFSNDAICYRKDFFYNSNHLNKVGAELFTRKFVDTLLYSNILRELKKK
jgi:hypothetical protein